MDATSQRLLDVPADVLRRRLRDQPVDGPDRAGRRRAGRPAVGARCARRYLDLGHTVEVIDPVPGLPDMVFAANGAHRRRRQGDWPRSSATRERADEAPAYRAWFEAAGFEMYDAEARQRGRGRLPARRRPPAGRHRLPHRARRARRGAGGLRPPGDHAAAGRPALLPPGHRAGRARRANRRLPARGVLARAARPCCASSSPTRSSPRTADAEVLGLNAVSDGQHVVLPAQATGLAAAAARARLRARSRSTCPSCARPAADRSAARWSCAGRHERS